MESIQLFSLGQKTVEGFVERHGGVNRVVVDIRLPAGRGNLGSERLRHFRKILFYLERQRGYFLPRFHVLENRLGAESEITFPRVENVKQYHFVAVVAEMAKPGNNLRGFIEQIR